MISFLFFLQKSRKIFTPCIIILKDVTLQSFVCVPQQKMFLVVDCCLLYLLLTQKLFACKATQKRRTKRFHNFKGVLLIRTVFSQITRSIPCSYVFVHCYFLVKTKQLTGNPRPSGEVINIVTTPSPRITFRLRT